MRVFGLDEATALLPTVQPLVAALLAARRDLAIGLLELETGTRLHSTLEETQRDRVLHEKVRRMQLRIVELVERVQAHGCVVKDVDLGLIDFPSLLGGQIVNLCWKMGEPNIGFWHGMEEGFASRKPLSHPQ